MYDWRTEKHGLTIDAIVDEMNKEFFVDVQRVLEDGKELPLTEDMIDWASGVIHEELRDE